MFGRHACSEDDRRTGYGSRRRRASRRRRSRLAALLLQPRSAGLRPAGRLRTAHGEPNPCRRRQAARRVRDRETGLRPGLRHAAPDYRGLPLGRGQDVLRAFRDRSAGDRGRHDQEPHADRHRPAAGRRIDHHPAGDEELPPLRRGFLSAQDPRDPARLPHRARALQGAHSRTLSQPDLSRARLLRCRGRRHKLLQQVARRADRRRGRLSRRPAQGAEQLPPRTPPRGGARAAGLRDRPDAERRAYRRGRGGARPVAPGDAHPARRGAGRPGGILRRGGAPRARRAVRDSAALWRRPVGEDHARSRVAGGRRPVVARRSDRLRPAPWLARSGGPDRPGPADRRPARAAPHRRHAEGLANGRGRSGGPNRRRDSPGVGRAGDDRPRPAALGARAAGGPGAGRGGRTGIRRARARRRGMRRAGCRRRRRARGRRLRPASNPRYRRGRWSRSTPIPAACWR